MELALDHITDFDVSNAKTLGCYHSNSFRLNDEFLQLYKLPLKTELETIRLLI
jgi:hypothetical protein